MLHLLRLLSKWFIPRSLASGRLSQSLLDVVERNVRNCWGRFIGCHRLMFLTFRAANYAALVTTHPSGLWSRTKRSQCMLRAWSSQRVSGSDQLQVSQSSFHALMPIAQCYSTTIASLGHSVSVKLSRTHSCAINVTNLTQRWSAAGLVATKAFIFHAY